MNCKNCEGYDTAFGCSAIKCKYFLSKRLSAYEDAEEQGRLVILPVQAADAIEGLSKPRWIPVTEKMPESGKVVIGYNGKRRFVAVMRVSGDNADSITHWMPLPNFPELKKEEA